LISYNLHYKTINDKRAADKTKAQVHPDGRPENKYLKSNSFIYIGKIFKIKVIFEIYIATPMGFSPNFVISTIKDLFAPKN